jgi:hypothetical protein
MLERAYSLRETVTRAVSPHEQAGFARLARMLAE